MPKEVEAVKGKLSPKAWAQATLNCEQAAAVDAHQHGISLGVKRRKLHPQSQVNC